MCVGFFCALLTCVLTSSDGVLLFGVVLLHLCSSTQLKPAGVAFSGLPKLLEQQRLFIVPQCTQALRPPTPTFYSTSTLQPANDITKDIRVGSVLVEGVTLQCLFDQLLGTGAWRGQYAFVVGTGTDFISENLQHPRCRALCGEFSGVVCRPLRGFSRRASIPTSVCSGFCLNSVSVTQSTVQDLENISNISSWLAHLKIFPTSTFVFSVSSTVINSLYDQKVDQSSQKKGTFLILLFEIKKKKIFLRNFPITFLRFYQNIFQNLLEIVVECKFSVSFLIKKKEIMMKIFVKLFLKTLSFSACFS